MASEKQINYLLSLLDKKGYSTRYMDASFSRLGATMRQRSGTVRGWLESMDKFEASRLIEQLKE